MLSLKCKLTPEDYIKANHLHMRPSPWVKYLSLAFFSFCLVILAASILKGWTDVITLIGPLLIFGFFYLFFLTIFPLTLIPWNVRRIFAQQKSLQVDYELLISPEMLETVSELGTTRFRLSDFHKYKVGKDVVLLYQSQVLFNIVPRRFFESEEDFKTFLAYLKAALGDPKL